MGNRWLLPRKGLARYKYTLYTNKISRSITDTSSLFFHQFTSFKAVITVFREAQVCQRWQRVLSSDWEVAPKNFMPRWRYSHVDRGQTSVIYDSNFPVPRSNSASPYCYTRLLKKIINLLLDNKFLLYVN